MMQEDVCIVLNERESLKKNMAEALEAALGRDGISARRLSIDHNIEEVILKQRSKIFVFDYLLGDFTTGLDIFYRLIMKQGGENLPAVIFLTDEPSVQAAVSAIKLGAKDYIQIDTPQALEHTLDAIKNNLPKKERITEQKEQEKLIGESATFHQIISQIKTLSLTSKPIIVIEGPQGSGKELIAKEILKNKNSTALIKSYDLRFFTESFERLFNNDSGLVLGQNLSIIAINCSDEHDELLRLASRPKVWQSDQSFLIVCTASHKVARSWLNLAPADYLLLPGLNERKEDIPILCQHFISKLSRLVKQSTQSFTPKTFGVFCNYDWTGGIDELKAVLTYCFSKNSDPKNIEMDIEAAKSIWEISNQAKEPSEYLDRQTVYRTLQDSNFQHRIAAAKLGCSVQTVHKILSQEADV